MNREIKYLPQVILIGDIGVGKTSLVKRYVEQGFSIKEKATIGVNLSTKEVTVDDDVVTLQIWDTAGFYCLKSAFKRGVVFCMLAFDVTSYSSFEGLDWWLDEFLLRARPRDPVNFPFIVVGNKVDLGNRIVSNREVNEWCQRNNNMPYFETSAKEGTNVDLAFQALFWNALKQESNQSSEETDSFDTIRLQLPDNYCEKSKEYKC